MEIKQNSKNREAWIDALKGLTIIAVVIGHCLDGYLNAAIVPKDSVYIFETLRTFIYSYHMPLFFILSGYTLHLAYIDNNQINKKDILGKY